MNNYALWLPSWYPTKLRPYDGDFVQRHAQSVSAFIPIHVFYVVRDADKQLTDSLLIEDREDGNIRETILYYASPKLSFKPLDRFLSLARFGDIYRNQLSSYFSKNGFPSIVNVHVAFKAGLIAKWIRRTFGIPYFLTEHWTGYLEEARPNINSISFARQYLISKIITEAELVLPVSQYLANAIQKKWLFVDCQVIPNVVNTSIFYPADEELDNGVMRLVHASTLTDQKDPVLLLRAASLLKQKNIRFRLDIYGPHVPGLVDLSAHEGLTDHVFFHGEVPQPVLAERVRQSHAMILYSKFETFGCVIIEANACGIPAIVSDTPLMHELVMDGVNGVMVSGHNAESLAEKLAEFSSRRHQFDKSVIVKTAQRYSYANVGRQYKELYDRFLGNHQLV